MKFCRNDKLKLQIYYIFNTQTGLIFTINISILLEISKFL